VCLRVFATPSHLTCSLQSRRVSLTMVRHLVAAALLSLLEVALSVETPTEGEKWWLRDELREYAKPWTDMDSGKTVFPPRQQELWGIDKHGQVIDPAQFEVAVDAIREIPLAAARTEVEVAETSPEDTPLIKEKPYKKDCLEIDVAYLPFDMAGQMMTYVDSWRSCQDRCIKTAGCKHFTYSPMDKGCHVTDSSFPSRGAFGSLAGPAVCPEEGEKISEYEVVGTEIAPPPLGAASPADPKISTLKTSARTASSASSLVSATLSSLVSLSTFSTLQQWTLLIGLLVFFAGVATSVGKWLRQQRRRKSSKTSYSALEPEAIEEPRTCRVV